MRMRLERIPEEDDEVDPALGDAGPDLLVAAQGAAQVEIHLEPQLGFEQVAGRARGEQLVALERAAIVASPLQEIVLAIVVGDESDALSLVHRDAAGQHDLLLGTTGRMLANAKAPVQEAGARG